jgi:hypothetical protein
MKKPHDFKTLEEYKTYIYNLREEKKKQKRLNSKSKAIVFKVSIEDEIKILEKSNRLNKSVSQYIREVILKDLKGGIK